jgi:serine protease Do
MNVKKVGTGLLFALVGALIAIISYNIGNRSEANSIRYNPQTNYVWKASLPEDFNPNNLDFTYAAERTVHGVVHVKMTRQREQSQIRDPMDYFFGPRGRSDEPQPQIGFGSGVIVSQDGYIVTNNHVISEADEIEVTLNDHRTFNAQIVGTDPNTDIALLKIEATNLPYIEFGDSDQIRIGEWVLAVGNPFGLTSSVTAGIISAKERVLGVLRDSEMPVESFLQTDAAVNMGNSGGALVNLRGELIGIPTLIISPTQTNIGTAFAVPTSIVIKVMDDIINYGEVRRGVLGISIVEINPEFAKARGLDNLHGVYVENVTPGGSADIAGIRAGDVIVAVNGNPVNMPGELQQQIGSHNPGDKVDLALKRNRNIININARLLDIQDHRELIRQQEETLMGATFRMVPEEIKDRFGLPGGVEVIDISPGKLQEAGMKEGFIIVAVNKQLISHPTDLVRLLEDYSGNVYIEGMYPDGTGMVFALNL